jgi:hypothetical protein
MASPRITDNSHKSLVEASHRNKKSNKTQHEIHQYSVNLNKYMEKVSAAAKDGNMDLLKTLLSDDFYVKNTKEGIGYDAKYSVWTIIAVGLAANNRLDKLITLQMPSQYQRDVYRLHVSYALAKINQQNIAGKIAKFIKPIDVQTMTYRLVEGYLDGAYFDSAISLIFTITTEKEFQDARNCFVNYFIRNSLAPSKLYALSHLAIDDEKAKRFNLLTIAYLERYVSSAMLNRREESIGILFNSEEYKKYRIFIFVLVMKLAFHAERVYVQLWEDIKKKMKFIVELVSQANDLSEFKEMSTLLIDTFKKERDANLNEFKIMCQWEATLYPEDKNIAEREKTRYFDKKYSVLAYNQACEDFADFSEKNSLDKIYSWLCKAIVNHQMIFMQRFIISLHLSEKCFQTDAFTDSEKSFSSLKSIPHPEICEFFYIMLCQFKPAQRDNLRFFELKKNKQADWDEKQTKQNLKSNVR